MVIDSTQLCLLVVNQLVQFEERYARASVAVFGCTGWSNNSK